MTQAVSPAAPTPPARTATRPEKLRLGDVLVQQRLISAEQLQQALELQRQTGKKVGRLLIEAGTIDTDGVRHSAKVAWRALANLQKEIERERR